MKLVYDAQADLNGRWYASTDSDGYDASGPGPLEAVSALVDVLANALYQAEEKASRRKPTLHDGEHDDHIRHAHLGDECLLPSGLTPGGTCRG